MIIIDKNNKKKFVDIRYKVITILNDYREKKWTSLVNNKRSFDELVHKACSYCEILVSNNKNISIMEHYLEKVQDQEGYSQDSFYDGLDFYFDLFVNYDI